MENVLYKNRTKEVNELIQLIMKNEHKIIIYNSNEGYGNTAFISRIQYILQSTKTLQILSAELSPHNTNPVQIITKNIVCKDHELYHNLQLFSNEENGIYTIPLSLSTIIKDLTQSETLAALFSEKEALPIYTGFYKDRLKENFFKLASHISEKKRIIIFIDNIQYMDNESIYELNSLIRKTNITFVLFKSGDSKNFEKFCYEIEYLVPSIEVDFPEPNIKYVQELAKIYDRNLSKTEADYLIAESKKNIRKLLYLIRRSNYNYTLGDFELELLKIMTLYDDYVSRDELFQICSFGPYSTFFSQEIVQDSLNKLEMNNYISSILSITEQKKKYKVSSHYYPKINIADKVIINRSLLHFYYNQKKINFKQLNHAFTIAIELKERDKQLFFSIKIVKEALQMGYRVENLVIEILREHGDYNEKLLAGTYLFCNANYQNAKSIFEILILQNTNRSLEVMYAITLNRCREHTRAEQSLNSLIQSSENIDELTILVTFLISNYVHSGDIKKAESIFEQYYNKLKSSIKYPYFLRNSATIFEFEKAYNLRNTAKRLFKESDDMFGYYTTIINTSAYYIKSDIDYALNQILMAFEELQQYNAQQIYLAANNLGICYFFKNKYMQAIKYFNLSIEIAKTIMPITYASINLSNIYIKIGEIQKAYECISELYEEVTNSNLPRLKARYYYQSALVDYIKGNFDTASEKCKLAKSYSISTATKRYFSALFFLSEKIEKEIEYSDAFLDELFSPCYLEYWTINSIDILDNDFLSF